MAGYGDVALKAVALISREDKLTPATAWDAAVAEAFPHSKSAQEKGCPRSTFLGLCESGRLKGVPPGRYTRSSKNKAYALLALDVLKRDPALAGDLKLLWNTVLSGDTKHPNHQMLVVVALWTENLVLP